MTWKSERTQLWPSQEGQKEQSFPSTHLSLTFVMAIKEFYYSLLSCRGGSSGSLSWLHEQEQL